MNQKIDEFVTPGDTFDSLFVAFDLINVKIA